MTTTLNIFDFIFLSFALIFIVVAFFRGFVKEIFSFIVWVIAFTASYFLAPLISSLLEASIANKMINQVVTRGAVFVLFFIGASMSFSSLINDLDAKTPASFNRSLGVLYGIIKTIIIVGISYSVMLNSLSYTYGEKIDKSSGQYPSWLKEAKTIRIVEISGDIMSPVVDKFFNSVSKNFDDFAPQQKDMENKINEIIEKNNQDYNSEEFGSQSNENQEKNDSGYSKKDIEKMNHLIEIIGK